MSRRNSNQSYFPGYRSYQFATKTICLILMISLLGTSTFAAPESARFLIVTAGETERDLRFTFLSNEPTLSKWSNSILGLFSGNNKQVTSITRIEILPSSDIHTRQGEPVALNAVAFGASGAPLGGVKFDWAVQDTHKGISFHHLPNENFTSSKTGNFIVRVTAEGVEAQTNITVGENPALLMMKTLKANEIHGRTALRDRLKAQGLYISSNISSKGEYRVAVQSADLSKNRRSTSMRAALHGPRVDEGEDTDASLTSERARMRLRAPLDDGWDNSNWWMADDPGNNPGNPPGSSLDAGAGSGNFQLSAPVVSLPGRGIDISLSLNYNSRVWSKAGNMMSFDSERGYPAPGWNLGFGKMMFMGTSGGCMLIDADGTNHSYTGSVSNYGSGSYTSSYFSGHTADGTLIDYSCSESTYSGVTSMAGTASLPNGTSIVYSAYSPNGKQAFPTQITDAQGNYINISYRNGYGPALQTVTDTMGRVITFNYDSLDRLISVDVPKVDNAGTRTAVRLHYRQITLSPGFAYPLTADTNNWYPYVIDAIYYPGTGTGYWFGADPAAADFNTYYSSYGMIAKVVEQRGMGWSGTVGDQGIVTTGTMSKQAVYNYTLTADSSITDAPTYTSLTESWAGMDTAPPATTYGINNNDYHWDGYSNSACTTITVTEPNGLISKQYSYRTPGTWTDGLVFSDETIQMVNGSPVIVASSLTSWQHGDYDSARPSYTTVTDEKGQTLKTTYVYGPSYNQITSQKQYDYDGTTLLRETRSTYENSSSYTNSSRHIFNLVKMSEVYDGAGNRVSKTDYEYDNNAVINGTGNPNLKATPSVTMHRSSYDPFTTETQQVQGSCTHFEPSYGNDPPCEYEGQETTVYPAGPYEDTCRCTEWDYYDESVYDSNTVFRGNVTKVTVYTDASVPTPSGPISHTRQYDTTGNLVAESASCCELKSYDFTVTTQYAYPTTQTRGSSDPNSTLRITASSVYDFNTGLIKQSIDANGRTSTFTYDADSLKPTASTASTGAYSRMTYDEPALSITEEIRDSDGNLAGKTIQFLNGLGKVTKEESYNPNNVVDTVETKYNNLGDVWKESRPYRTNDTVYWSERFYDAQGRLTKIVAPDSSETKAFYNESQYPDSATTAGNNVAPGSTIRVMDAWGRERWGRFDALGRLVEVVEPNPDKSANSTGSIFSTGSLVTKFTYDTVDQLTQVNQGPQLRKFKYDSIGRLTRQKLAEQTATLDDSGNYVGPNQTGSNWGEAFFYDDRSNLTRRVDARGAQTAYSYQINNADDPLNRIQSKSYSLLASHESDITINSASTVAYTYVTTGDQSRISQIRTSGFLTEDYSYDTEGRVSEYKQTVDYRTTQPMTVNYLYDSLDRVKEITYPAQYGMTGNPRKILSQTYDTASRLLSLKLDNTEVAGNFSYDASDESTQIKIGPSGTNQVIENYTFDPQTGLLTGQTSVMNGTTLLNLSYDYGRNNSVGSLSGKTGHLTKVLNNLDHSKDREYEFDVLGRLTKMKGGLGGVLSSQQYSYDRYGNRTSVNATGFAADNSIMPIDGIPNLAFDNTSNRITTSGFQYDYAGNQVRALAEDGVTWVKYDYDMANRLQTVKRDDSNQTLLQAFQFGSTNARLIDYDPAAGLNTFICSIGGATLAQYVEYAQYSFSWTKLYTYLGSSLLSTITPNGSAETTEYDHPDGLGTRTISNQQAGTSYEQSNLPFGKALTAESSGSATKRFTSYERSTPTGLDYAINRTYDSMQGRFTQVDPIGMGGVSLEHPQSLNLYSYCGNDPVNNTDSDGLFWGSLFKWIGKIFNAFTKILKWIFVAIAVAAVVIAAFYSTGAALGFLKAVFGFIGHILGVSIQNAPYIYSLATGAETGGLSVSIGIGGKVLAGFYAVGLASSFAQTKKKKGKGHRKVVPFVRGGDFSPSVLAIITKIRGNVDTLLQDPKCAAVLGGSAKAKSLAAKAVVLNADNVNPKFRGSGGGTTARAARQAAEDAGSNNLAVSEVPGKYIFLNHRLFDRGYTDLQMETVYIHELHRLGGLGGNSEAQIKGDYANIIAGCGTQDPYPPKPSH